MELNRDLVSRGEVPLSSIVSDPSIDKIPWGGINKQTRGVYSSTLLGLYTSLPPEKRGTANNLMHQVALALTAIQPPFEHIMLNTVEVIRGLNYAIQTQEQPEVAAELTKIRLALEHTRQSKHRPHIPKRR